MTTAPGRDDASVAAGGASVIRKAFDPYHGTFAEITRRAPFLYAERRVTPLNLDLRDEHEAAARDVVLDYGQAIKDPAATNIFPGDLLLKKFGVTGHGRVIFYDYDELCLLTDPSRSWGFREASATPFSTRTETC